MIAVAPQIPEQILLEWLRHQSWENENVCSICGSRPGWGICFENMTGVGRHECRGFLIYRGGVSESAHAVICQRHRASSIRASQQASSSTGLARGVGVKGGEGMGKVSNVRSPRSISQGVARWDGE